MDTGKHNDDQSPFHIYTESRLQRTTLKLPIMRPNHINQTNKIKHLIIEIEISLKMKREKEYHHKLIRL